MKKRAAAPRQPKARARASKPQSKKSAARRKTSKSVAPTARNSIAAKGAKDITARPPMPPTLGEWGSSREVTVGGVRCSIAGEATVSNLYAAADDLSNSAIHALTQLAQKLDEAATRFDDELANHRPAIRLAAMAAELSHSLFMKANLAILGEYAARRSLGQL